jgi:hypothetical protein
MVAFNTAIPSPYRDKCHSLSDTLQACRYFDTNITWAVLGDSHGIELAYALAERLKKINEGLIQLTNSSPPSYMFSTGNKHNDEWLANSVSYLLNHNEISTVVLVWRHSSYLYGNNEEYYPEVLQEEKTLYIADGKNPTEKRVLYMKSFCGLANKLVQAGKKVYVMLPVPEQGNNVNTFFRKIKNGDVPGISLDYYRKRNHFFFDHISKLDKRVLLINPLEATGISGINTLVIKHDTSLYFDDNHLSLPGAEMVARTVIR